MKYTKYLLFSFIFVNTLFGASWFQSDSVDTYEEEVYLSFRYKGVIDAIVVAYYDGKDFFLPVTELFDLFAINYELDSKSYSIYGFYLKEDTKYLLDYSRRFAMLKDEVWSLRASDYRVKEIDFYMKPEIFEEVFGLSLEVNISQLTIKLETRDKLPIQIRYSRRQQQELMQRYSRRAAVDTSYYLLNNRQPHLADGVLFDYSMNNTFSSSGKTLRLNVGAGGELLYGDVQGNFEAKLDQDEVLFTPNDLKWRFVDQRSSWFTSVSLGQQSTQGLINRQFQGLSVSNEPLVQNRSYDTYVIDGNTEPEAEVELYQDGRLVEVSSADDIGYYRFLVPLSYGSSEYKIRIYAKQGRTIELDRMIQIPFNFLPTGDIRYNVTAGRIASEELDWQEQGQIANGNIAMGVSNWFTSGIGVEYVEKNNSDHPVFYTRFSMRVPNDLLVNLDLVANSYSKLSLRRIGSNASSMSMEYAYFNQPGIYNSTFLKHKFNTNGFYPFKFAGMRFSGRGAFGWENKQNQNVFDISAYLSQTIGSIRLRYGIKENYSVTEGIGNTRSGDLQFAAVYIIPRLPRYHPYLRGSYFRVDLGYDTGLGKLEDIRFQMNKQFSNQWKVQSFFGYNIVSSNMSFDIGIVWDFDKIRSSMSLRSSRSTPSVLQTMRGSVVWDRASGDVIWDNRQQVGRSGLAVRMFLDENNSSTYDEGEEIIPGNALTIYGASSRRIKKNGVTRLTQLQPYRRYNIHVNEARINNPMLVPSYKDFSVITDPNRIKWLDVPLFTTGIIDGHVDKLKNGEFVPISGLRIHVKRDDSDNEQILRTFGDGSFYSMEIPPGDYEMWVDNSQLEFLGMNSQPEKRYFTINPSSDGDYVENLNFLLK